MIRDWGHFIRRPLGELGACWKLWAEDAARGDDSEEIESSGRRHSEHTAFITSCQNLEAHCCNYILYTCSATVMLTLKGHSLYSKHSSILTHFSSSGQSLFLWSVYRQPWLKDNSCLFQLDKHSPLTCLLWGYSVKNMLTYHQVLQLIWQTWLQTVANCISSTYRVTLSFISVFSCIFDHLTKTGPIFILFYISLVLTNSPGKNLVLSAAKWCTMLTHWSVCCLVLKQCAGSF